MKKSFLTLACILLCTGIEAQTFTSGHLTVTIIDSLHHDSTDCSTGYYMYYDISIDSSYTGQTVYTIDTFYGFPSGTFINTSGVSPWSFITSVGGGSGGGGSIPGVHDFTISPGGFAHNVIYYSTRKITAGFDTVFATPYPDSIYVPDPCSYSTVSGQTYVDNNGNCIYDAGDEGLSSIVPDINVTETFVPGGGGWNQGLLSGVSIPTYSIQAQQSWMATCTVSVPSYYYFIFSSACFAGPYVFTSLPATGADFPFQCTSNVDVQCAALSPGTVRQHTPFLMQPYVSNTGCDAASGQMKLIKDPHVLYDASLSSHPADAVAGDTLIWNYSGLTNISGSGYWNSFMSSIHLTPDATVLAGDTLCFRVLANIPSADINPVNNDYSFCLPVVYSYDPNIKEVIPRGTGPEGFIPGHQDTLEYTLHFQNTGSADAHDIKIIDTLDSHLNVASLKILGTSHNMSPRWLTPNVVQFTFDNINLPDSNSNEPASHGAVRFSVALNAGLPVGTEIRNTGYIYFDLNPPVITNTVLNTLITPTTVEHAVKDVAVKIYPNPATDNITVENLGGGEILIANMNGVVLIRQQITNDRTTIDVSRLPTGVYILKTSNNLSTNTNKFIKY